MQIDNKLIKELIIRFLIITGLIIAIGYYLYENSVFTPTHWPFQFFVSGITVGIAYSTFYKNNHSMGIIILFIWYIFLTSLILKRDSWVFILEGTYISFFTASVYIYILIIQKYIKENILLRFIVSCILFGITNSLIVVFLNLLSPDKMLTDIQRILTPIILNLEIGAGIGLFFGIGVQLSDSFIKTILSQNKVTS